MRDSPSLSTLTKTAILAIDTKTRVPITFAAHTFHKFRTKDAQLYDLAELFHENSKLRRHLLPDLQSSAGSFDDPLLMASVARTERTYPSTSTIALPDPPPLSEPIGATLRQRRSVRHYDPTHPLRHAELAALLRYGYGISHTASIRLDDGRDVVQHFLTVPSGGALYPLELYLLAINVEGMRQSLYHYNYRNNTLEDLDSRRTDYVASLLGCFPIHPEGIRMDRLGALFLISAAFWRSKLKYGARAYRYVLQESGHLAQNLCLAATALKCGSLPLAAFYDDELNHLVGVDGVDEAVIYAVGIGHPDPHEGQRHEHTATSED